MKVTTLQPGLKWLIPAILPLLLFTCKKDCSKTDVILADDVLTCFEGFHISEIKKTCGGDPAICMGFDTTLTDTIEILKEGAQARIKYTGSNLNRVMDFDSVGAQNKVYFRGDYSLHEVCKLILDAKTDSFFIQNRSGGQAATLQWDIKGKK